MLSRLAKFGTLVAMMSVAATGCSDAPDEAEAVLAPRAQVADDSTVAALTQVTGSGELLFSALTPQLARAQAGDVLIFGVSAPLPQGALRKITGKSAAGEGVRLATEQAPMSDAFERLRFSVEKEMEQQDVAVELPEPVAGRGYSFPFELEASGDNGRARVNGSLALRPELDFNFDLNWTEFSLKEMNLTFGMDESFDARLVGTGRVQVAKSVDVATIPFTPIILTIPTPVGAVPLVITPQVKVNVGLEGEVGGGFTASVFQQSHVEASVGVIDGEFGGKATHDNRTTSDVPAYQGNARLRAYGGPRFEVLLYGAIGPYATAEGTLDLAANAGGPPLCIDWTLSGGIRAKAGVDLIADFESTLVDESAELTGYAGCGGNPGAPQPPPVSTWTKRFGREGSPADSARGILELSSGGYLVVGDTSVFGGVTGSHAGIWLQRLTPEGETVWQRTFGGVGAGAAKGATEVDGGFIVANGSGLLKVDLAGNPEWVRQYVVPVGENLEIRALTTAGAGDVAVAGTGGPSNPSQGWAMRVDANGAVVWSRLLGGTRANSIRTTTSGDLLLAGRNGIGAFVLRLSPSGAIVSASRLLQRYDDNGEVAGGTVLDADSELYDVVETAGGLLAVGSSYGAYKVPPESAGGFFAAWKIDLAANGDVLRDGDENVLGNSIHRVGDTTESSELYLAAPRSDSAPVAVGQRRVSVSTSDSDLFVQQGGATRLLRTTGEDACFFPANNGGGRTLVATRDGGYALAATTDGFRAGASEMWILKLGRTADADVGAGASFAPTQASSIDNTFVSASVAGPSEPPTFSVTAEDTRATLRIE